MHLLGPPNFWVAVLALQKPLLDFFFIGIETFFFVVGIKFDGHHGQGGALALCTVLIHPNTSNGDTPFAGPSTRIASFKLLFCAVLHFWDCSINTPKMAASQHET